VPDAGFRFFLYFLRTVSGALLETPSESNATQWGGEEKKREKRRLRFATAMPFFVASNRVFFFPFLRFSTDPVSAIFF